MGKVRPFRILIMPLAAKWIVDASLIALETIDLRLKSNENVGAL